MGALTRFFLPKSEWAKAPYLCLKDEEAHHCAVVMRKSPGSLIEVFDGEGRWAHAKIVGSVGKSLELEVQAHGVSTPSRAQITLLQSIPKGSNMDWIIEKAVELGVRRIVPILTERTVVRLDDKEKAKKVAKWQRVVLEACKQCGQNWLPEIALPVSYAEAINQAERSQDLRLMAALQPDSQHFAQALQPFKKGQETLRVALAVGPEGDFSEKEYQAARERGFQFVTLGPIVLRVETATMYAFSVLAHELNPSS